MMTNRQNYIRLLLLISAIILLAAVIYLQTGHSLVNQPTVALNILPKYQPQSIDFPVKRKGEGDHTPRPIYVTKKITQVITSTLTTSNSEENSAVLKFEIREDFNLPCPQVTVPVQEIIHQQWVEDLRNILHKIPSKSLISIVTCDLTFKGVLLNWLVSSLLAVQPPLNNIVVLTLDQPLHSLLQEHGFNSLLLRGNEVLKPSRAKHVQTHSRTPKLPLVMVWRLTVIRLLNYWGYDFATYDTDAMVLKNTQQLFYGELSSSHIISSRANFPAPTSKKYGLTMCGGMYMIKSSPLTGMKLQQFLTFHKCTSQTYICTCSILSKQSVFRRNLFWDVHQF